MVRGYKQRGKGLPLSAGSATKALSSFRGKQEVIKSTQSRGQVSPQPPIPARIQFPRAAEAPRDSSHTGRPGSECPAARIPESAARRIRDTFHSACNCLFIEYTKQKNLVTHELALCMANDSAVWSANRGPKMEPLRTLRTLPDKSDPLIKQTVLATK